MTRSFDAEARVWVSDDTYRGQVTRASSMNRYAYVEGAPESFVDHLGFFRAAAALEAQRLAAAEAAWLAANKAARSAAPTTCSGYGCYMQWQAEAPARRLAQQPLHVRGYAYAMQVQAYQAYQVQLAKYQAENYAFARAGTTREAEALRIYNEKLAIHHRWVAEQAGIEHERAQLLFYDTVTATAKTLSDPSTAIHLTLDVLGMIPVIGEPADGLNAIIYLAEGDEVNAAISAAGMIPIGGMAVTGARAVKTAVKTGLRAAEQIAATSLSMLKVAPPAPTAVLKIDTSAATPPTSPIAAAVPPAAKPADSVPAPRQAVEDLADAQRRPPKDGDPKTVAVLETPSGNSYSGTSGSGITPHPTVQKALDDVPTDTRLDFHGQCAEISCLTQALEAGDEVAGSTIQTARVRGLTSPFQGTSIDPCPSCSAVLEELDVIFDGL